MKMILAIIGFLLPVITLFIFQRKRRPGMIEGASYIQVVRRKQNSSHRFLPRL